MTTPHTPGPWSFDGQDIWAMNGGGENVAANVCRLMGHKAYYPANAALIAAAPELLEALKVALDDINSIIEKDVLDGLVASPDDHTLASAHRMAWCAIARAEGRKEAT